MPQARQRTAHDCSLLCRFMDEAQLGHVTVPGTEVQQCSIVVPTREAPYFARQHFTFPAAPLSDVAPAASQVSSSTLGTGLYGVVRCRTPAPMHAHVCVPVCRARLQHDCGCGPKPLQTVRITCHQHAVVAARCHVSEIKVSEGKQDALGAGGLVWFWQCGQCCSAAGGWGVCVNSLSALASSVSSSWNTKAHGSRARELPLSVSGCQSCEEPSAVMLMRLHLVGLCAGPALLA